MPQSLRQRIGHPQFRASRERRQALNEGCTFYDGSGSQVLPPSVAQAYARTDPIVATVLSGPNGEMVHQELRASDVEALSEALCVRYPPQARPAAVKRLLLVLGETTRWWDEQAALKQLQERGLRNVRIGDPRDVEILPFELTRGNGPVRVIQAARAGG